MARVKGVLVLLAVCAAGWGVLLAYQNAPWLVLTLVGAWLAYLLLGTFRWIRSRSVPVEERPRSSIGSQWVLSGVAVAVLALGTFVAAGVQSAERQRAQQRQDLAERGYEVTGELLTASECSQKGGAIEGDFCLREADGGRVIPDYSYDSADLLPEAFVEVGACGQLIGNEMEIHATCRGTDDHVVVKAPIIGTDETAKAVARRKCPPQTVVWTKDSPLRVVCWAER